MLLLRSSKYLSIAQRKRKALLTDKIIIGFWRLIFVGASLYLILKLIGNVHKERIPNEGGSEGGRTVQQEERRQAR